MTPPLGPTGACVQTATVPQVVPVAPPGRVRQVDFRSLLLDQSRGALQDLSESSRPRSAYGAAGNHRSLSSPRHVDRLPSPSTTKALTPHSRETDPDDTLDPIHRHRASFAPPELQSSAAVSPLAHDASSASPDGAGASSVRAATSLEDLLPTLVRRIAWSGDRHRGTVRLELGAGELAGATLIVHAENGQVRVHMDVPPGTDAARWRQRICDRLASRGVLAASVEVT